MKKILCLLSVIACAAGALGAQEAIIMYAKGQAQVQNAQGARRNALVGRKVLLNETCLTGKASLLELQAGHDTITLRENTVFKLLEAQKQGQRQNAYACALGSMNLKIKSVSGVGPRITSGSSSCGVRGTAFEVYAGVDGSSLILVTEGRVEVEAQGKAVLVDPNEGVEVKPGRAPGEKFGFRKPIDYSDWNQGKFEEFEKDPVAAITAVEKQIDDYLFKINNFWIEYKKLWLEYEKENEMKIRIAKEQGDQAGSKYNEEHVKPINNELFLIFTDIRFYSLSALSLRRFVAGRIYLHIRTSYFNDVKNKLYQDFMIVYERTIYKFTTELLGEEDFGEIFKRKFRFIEATHI